MRFFAIAATVLCLGAGAASAQTVSFATNPPGTVAYASGAAIAKLYNENTGQQMRVVAQGGPEAILPLLVEGEFQFSMANAVAINFAYQGRDTFEEPLENLRAVAAVFPLRIGMFVRADSGIEDIAGLKGKRVAWGYPQQRNLHTFSLAFMAAGGLSEADIERAIVPNGARGTDDFVAGSLDAALFSMTAGRMAEVDVSVDGLRWLPLPDTDEAQAIVDEQAPGARIEVLQPGPAIVGLDEAAPMLSVPFVILTSADADDETVYNLLKTVYENKSELESAVPAFKAASTDGYAADVGIPYHPAALRFFKEVGVEVAQD